MGFEIRRVRPAEWEEAGEVTALAYAEFGPSTSSNDEVRDRGAWEAYFGSLRDVKGRDAVAPVFVAIDPDEGRVLGSLTLETDVRVNPDSSPLDPDEAHIRMLGVHPDARRRGVGKALMDHALAASQAAGKSRVTLHSTMPMETARGMYERMGFVLTEQETFDDGFCLFSYELAL